MKLQTTSKNYHKVKWQQSISIIWSDYVSGSNEGGIYSCKFGVNCYLNESRNCVYC